MADLPNEIYLLIFKNIEPIDRIDILCTCKLFLDLCLRYLWQPHKYISSRRLRCYMVDDGQSMDYKGPVTGLLWAISEGYVDYFKKWSIVEPFNSYANHRYPYHKAIENNQIEMVKYMMSLPNINTNLVPGCCFNPFLVTACLNGSLEMVKLLMSDERVKVTCDVEECNENLLLKAIRSENSDMVQLVLTDPKLCIIPTAKDINDIKTKANVFKTLWLDKRIDRKIGHNMLNRILTCYSDDSVFNDASLAKLILDDLDLTVEQGINYVELAYSRNRPRILKLVLKHPILKDFDYSTFKKTRKNPVKRGGLSNVFHEIFNDDGT